MKMGYGHGHHNGYECVVAVRDNMGMIHAEAVNSLLQSNNSKIMAGHRSEVAQQIFKQRWNKITNDNTTSRW